MRARAFGLALIATSLSASALAQDLTRCREPVAAEVAVPAHRVAAKDITSRLAGRTLVYVRPRITTYGFTRYTTEIRADGSLAHSFETSGYRDGPWRKGEFFSAPGGKIDHGGRTVGVWRVRDGLFCVQLVSSESEVCYEIYLAQCRYHAKLAAATNLGACLQGAFSIR